MAFDSLINTSRAMFCIFFAIFNALSELVLLLAKIKD